MRIYKNFAEAVDETKRNLYEMGIRVHPHSMQNKIVKNNEEYSSLEIQGEVFSVEDTSDRDKMVGDNLAYCKAEFAERIVKTVNPGKSYKLRLKVWKEFLVNEKMDYTYSERMFPQLEKTIAEMKRNPDTRQAIIEIHNNKLDLEAMGGKKRIPCSMYYQLMIRKDPQGIPRVNIIYTMRSCDYYTHFKNDMWLACELKDYVAKRLGIKPGTFTMFIGSLHAYKKDFETGVF